MFKILKNVFMKKSKIVIGAMTMAMMLSQIAFAAETSTSTATLKATYRHPVSGIIEDAGGESGEAIGQGMVENVMESNGLLEVDASNNIYLTIRFKMTDSLSKLSFLVQKTDATSWSSTQTEKVGESSSDHTVDYRILMPSNDGVIQVSAYVAPMGRNVVFYLQVTDIVSGNQTSFTPMSSSVDTQVTLEDTTTDTSASTSNLLSEETGLTMSEYGATTDTATTDESQTASEEAVAATAAALLAEQAENQAAKAATNDEYIVVEDSSFLQVNHQFWLYLFLEMVTSMVVAGLILMGIHALIRRFTEEKKRYRLEQGATVLEDEEDELYEQ